jgi:hypothetical protein
MEDTNSTAGKTVASSAKRRDDLTTRIDPPHTTPFQPASSGIDLQRSAAARGNAAKAPAAVKPAIASAKSPTQFINGADDEESPPSNKLSRAERKRLRKQQRADRFDDE